MKLYEKTHIFSHTEDSIGLNALQPNTNEVNVILFALLRALKDTLKFPRNSALVTLDNPQITLSPVSIEAISSVESSLNGQCSL